MARGTFSLRSRIACKFFKKKSRSFSNLRKFRTGLENVPPTRRQFGFKFVTVRRRTAPRQVRTVLQKVSGVILGRDRVDICPFLLLTTGLFLIGHGPVFGQIWTRILSTRWGRYHQRGDADGSVLIIAYWAKLAVIVRILFY